MEPNNCIYCGEKASSIRGNEAEPICTGCMQSKGDRLAGSWFFWLKSNDLSYWQKIVDQHRMGMDDLASTIRKIRIDL